ncbi:hypothetical protein TraAM80_06450 [Trypanosoma rangeli]|uniref:Uncharacterized protein n=1 Tax=Trypanosoma rangeli TaxID=5698 RepID=A0A422NAB6_TRYRA|nr:uncharacterized protein TraAM80_06450 [Trypanosoma rangeli]RNF02372.1 hypothetical protein TraAM80_06450 [Trypanosoma rangeli]|eukprot:RNF02372.1 hypothetical protein TraAM80_06450 [Trypanosoma rangeli]
MNENQTTGSALADTQMREKDTPHEQAQQPEGVTETPTENYDPNYYQNYYYEPSDGNYYYYPPQDGITNEADEDAGEVPVTPENLIRSYEFEDWEPRSYGWYIDTILEIFMSVEFRLYLFFLLYCTGVLLLVLSLNWTFEVLFRMHVSSSGEQFDPTFLFGFFVVFILLSFTLVTWFCTWMDILKGLKHVKRDDVYFLGMSHYSGKNPPYIVYLVVILATTVFPFLWSVIATSTNNQSILFFAQSYAFISIIVTMFGILFCYAWLYWSALRLKQQAFKKRKERDEFTLWEKAASHRGARPLKKRWYHASTVLEEFGLDGKSLRWNAVVFTIGYVPLLALYMAQVLRSLIGSPQVTWGAAFSITLTCVYAISWLSLLHRKAQYSVYLSLYLITALLVAGLVCGGILLSKELTFMVIVLFIAAQGMLTRKTPHTLTRKEKCVLFQIPLDAEMQHDVQRRRFDTHLLCCRDAVMSCLKCFDVKTFFGYRHPDIVRAENQYALHNIAIRTDQKVLLYWWLILLFALAFVISIGNVMVYEFTSNIATKGGPIIAQNSKLPLCSMRYNQNGSAPLTIYDLSLLSALAYTFAGYGDADFATWFSQFPQLIRQYPLRLQPNWDYATSGMAIPFSDYTDLRSDYHFVTLNSNNRGLSLLRNVDEWGTTMALQVAGAISPLFSIWPENYRTSFVYGASFLTRWFPSADALKGVSEYIEGLISAGKQDRILLIGDQFNGGYAKILSYRYNLPFVAFNPPGTRYKLPLLDNGVQITLNRGVLSYIDSLEDTLNTIHLQCSSRYSSSRCSRIETTIDAIGAMCGDSYGRRLK